MKTSHQQGSITLLKEKLIGLPCIALMDLFSLPTPMLETCSFQEKTLQLLDTCFWLSNSTPQKLMFTPCVLENRYCKRRANITMKQNIKETKKNMNNVVSKKCGYSPNDIEKKFLASKKVRTLFNFHRIVQRKKYTINSINTIEKNTNQKRKNCTKIWRLMKRYQFWPKEYKKIRPWQVLYTNGSKHFLL